MLVGPVVLVGAGSELLVDDVVGGAGLIGEEGGGGARCVLVRVVELTVEELDSLELTGGSKPAGGPPVTLELGVSGEVIVTSGVDSSPDWPVSENAATAANPVATTMPAPASTARRLVRASVSSCCIGSIRVPVDRVCCTDPGTGLSPVATGARSRAHRHGIEGDAAVSLRATAEIAPFPPGRATSPFRHHGRMERTRLTAWVHGRVQGVGFRWWTRSRALELGLVGTATNLPANRVEVVAEGPPDACEKLLAALRSDATPGRVDHVAEQWSEPRDAFTGFQER